MSISGIGVSHYSVWQEAGRVQKNNSGIGFASRMADMVGTNAYENGRKTNAASGRDNYVGRDVAGIYSMGVYSRKDISASQDLNLPIETERYKIEDASYVEGVPAYDIVDKLNGRVLADKESEKADRQESKTKTDIIIRPDGSRVLVMTMSIGGMETTMSLEISKPTEAPNENSKQDTDNNMPSTDAEMDTVSDEMSNISIES